MKKAITIILALLFLLLSLGGCGRSDTPEPSPAAESAAPGAPGAAESEAAFPLLSAPFSAEETEAMINHNARRRALLLETRYVCAARCRDGSRALLRYEVIDGGLHERAFLLGDCEAECLCADGERLYFLGRDGRVESIRLDGGEHRVEWETPCLHLQLFDGALCALTEDGALVRLGDGETLLDGCADAFLCSQGLFYTARADGRAHLRRSGTREDVTLTAERAEQLTLVGTTLYYAAPTADGLRQLCALDLASGARYRQSAAVAGFEIVSRPDGSWVLRLTGAEGEAGQRVLPLERAFDEPLGGERSDGGRLYRCCALDDLLRTELILSPQGEELGLALALPDGRQLSLLAENNPPK